MHKEATYKEKYADLKEWMPIVLDEIKKDLKNEHLKKDFYFIKKYLSSKNLNKLSLEDLVEAYSKAIAEDENGEGLGEFITSRWLLKNTEVYDFFEAQLVQVTTDFSALNELDLNLSTKLMEDSIRQFGAVRTYLFAVLNSVVFPKAIFEQLRTRARQDQQQEQAQQEMISQKMTLEQMQKTFETEIARLTDKYEKKLSGLQKKYLIDTDGLKKQMASLQRKLQERK